jgi:large subunit ribosomal protein L3
MRNMEVVEIRLEDNIILIKGVVPGAKSGLVTINKLKF